MDDFGGGFPQHMSRSSPFSSAILPLERPSAVYSNLRHRSGPIHGQIVARTVIPIAGFSAPLSVYQPLEIVYTAPEVHRPTSRLSAQQSAPPYALYMLCNMSPAWKLTRNVAHGIPTQVKADYVPIPRTPAPFSTPSSPSPALTALRSAAFSASSASVVPSLSSLRRKLPP